ncbi:uncharacterized protein KY384_004993 [Bacidia gigantensis]|uniref:uncharacterized protein n=1 Tax=Bacidia gigantensis TaxID=2732470 RepID=UPI001D0595C1|nr:uncharacterized protein KY384_004993 [Bacidia gigantensis]KAG8530490.1 hypothetical protein KY384_004993 [Bacidia gigantensis]
MTRPHIIRADTIDLQDQDAPSAKDHTRQPARPSHLGDGPPAPHQAEALKHVELEINEQHGRSPRASTDLSGKELQLLHDESEANGYQDPSENLLRNSAQHAAQDEVEEEGDDGLDDDMNDKISSSPSIGDDGGFPAPKLPWPTRTSLVYHPVKKAAHPPGPPMEYSSSPYEETPEHFPFASFRQYRQFSPSKVHHQEGEYVPDRLSNSLVDEIEIETDRRNSFNESNSRTRSSYINHYLIDLDEDVDDNLDLEDFHHMLLPEMDPLLDDGSNDLLRKQNLHNRRGSPTSSSSVSVASWYSDTTTRPPDDDTKDIFIDLNSRFIDSGWGGECLREIEDIDFEFVYALHTFVATVEGQANATKGDNMVLLDDSNSYWWLVRVIKDNSIGYLPAEHIETPLERLARLNKHRNLDTMLGDQDDDKRQPPLNPLRKAIRRRNGKKVEFTQANSYLEPEAIEYSSEEEDDETAEQTGQDPGEVEEVQKDQTKEREINAAPAATVARDGNTNGRRSEPSRPEVEARNGVDPGSGVDQVRNSDESSDRADDGMASKSRKGTVRNTDSFFKDESLETRKISLTPSLLREDSSAGPQQTPEVQEMKIRGSLDSLEKDEPTGKAGTEKRKKEKKGMLGGMFRRKDKKKGQDKDTDDIEKTSSEMSRKSPTPKESLESMDSKLSSPHRQTSKLQKQPPAKLSPKSSYTTQNQNNSQRSVSSGPSNLAPDPDRRPTNGGPDGSMRLVLPESQPLFDHIPSPLQSKSPNSLRDERVEDLSEGGPVAEPLKLTESPREKSSNMFSPVVNALRPSPSEPKPVKTKRSKERMHMDDFDSSSASSAEQQMERPAPHEIQQEPEPERELVSQPSDHHLNVAQAAQHETHPPASKPEPIERLSESPVEVPPPSAQERSTPHQPPPLITDNSSQDDDLPSPSSPSSSPELIEAPISSSHQPQPSEITTTPTKRQITTQDLDSSPASQPSIITTNTTTTTEETRRSTPTWSDASLRAYMDDDSEIRDLLIIVHDKTGVIPKRDHPVVQGLYKEENQKLAQIERQLDGLLGDFLARKSGKMK